MCYTTINKTKVTVTILPIQQHKGDKIIGRLSWAGLQFNLHELVILADLIQKQDPSLGWDWFVGKMMDTIEARLVKSVWI